MGARGVCPRIPGRPPLEGGRLSPVPRLTASIGRFSHRAHWARAGLRVQAALRALRRDLHLGLYLGMHPHQPHQPVPRGATAHQGR